MQARGKVYVEGSRPDVRVPFAEVGLTGDNSAGAALRHVRPRFGPGGGAAAAARTVDRRAG